MTDNANPKSQRRISFVDSVMLVLAVVAFADLVWIKFFDVSPQTHRIGVIADLAFCAVFAVEFLWRWRQAKWNSSFPMINWYEIVGMVPIASPFFRAFRLLRVIPVVYGLLQRANRRYEDKFLVAFINRFIQTIVGTIKRPVTIAVLDEVANVLREGHYTQNVARALEENRVELSELVLDLIKNDPQTRGVKFVPFHDEVVRLAANTTFRIVFQALNDPRTDELISDMIRENVEQIRTAVREKSAAEGPQAPMVTTPGGFKPPDSPAKGR